MIGILFNRKSQTILFSVANGNITEILNSSLLKEIPVIDRDFFIIRQPLAGSPSFDEVEVWVPTILPGGLALVLGLVGLIAAVGSGSALIAGLIGYNLLNKEKQQEKTDFPEQELTLDKIKTIIEIYYRFEA